ncbi:hypothetical protein CCH79_00009517 [Gambusia affinis]|uniref:Uncharacterized protein n=1 Tax=Gambusia affinis TaxID=33528 RepID=A0A315VCJ3_GAMAF|nr:hypothetical protein CCH79_00009517 [Gambusia affinis]
MAFALPLDACGRYMHIITLWEEAPPILEALAPPMESPPENSTSPWICTAPIPGQEIPAAAFQSVSLHGTLPRRRRGGANVSHSNQAWDLKTNQTQPLLSGTASVPAGLVLQPAASSLAQNISDDFKSCRGDWKV